MIIALDDRELLQDVTASVIIPSDSTASLDEIVGQAEIEQRTTLYFGKPFCIPTKSLSLTHSQIR